MTTTKPSVVPTRSDDTNGVRTGFVAPERLRANLQRVLVNLIDLQLTAKQAHWNLVGPNFRDIHLNLDEVVAIVRQGVDDVAERMRALQTTPDGRAGVVAGDSSLPLFPAGEVSTHTAVVTVVEAIEVVTGCMREVHDAVDEDDPTSADMLHEYLTKLEQQAWFLSSEVRTAT